MGKKRKRRIKGTKELTPEAKETARQAKVLKLQTLQSNREQRKYIRLLKTAENRLHTAQTAKKLAIAKVEQAQAELKAAEGFLDEAAREVTEWETKGIVVEKTFSNLNIGDEVVIAHYQDQLGVKSVTENIDPQLIYGTALTTAQAGTKVQIQKKDFIPVETQMPGPSEFDQEVLDQIGDTTTSLDFEDPGRNIMTELHDNDPEVLSEGRK